MSAPVAVVTDSTACLPRGSADSAGVLVVPLRVQLGSRSGLDGLDVSPADVAKAMLAHETVTTSRPAPADFARVYEQAIAAGASAVVSIHLSAALSGTCDAARLAAAEFDGAVTVVDSASAAMGMGFSVLAAARHAQTGASRASVLGVVEDTLRSSALYCYVDSLDWLRRGGRIGSATALVGTALSVKPILQLRDGKLTPLEKVRTSGRALSRLVELTRQASDGRRVDVAVQHLATPDRAAAVLDLLRAALPDVGELVVCEVSAVIGAHVGPGVIGVSLSAAGSTQRSGQWPVPSRNFELNVYEPPTDVFNDT